MTSDGFSLASRSRTGFFAIVGALIVVLGTLLVHVSPWLTAGLGDSHDGYNAAVWGLGARGAVEDPIGNRLGGIHPDGSAYANHPPLLVWSLIPSAAIAEDSPLGLRLVPLTASLASIALLTVLLLDAGISRWATAAGVLLAGTSSMYLTYGAMVDTPVFGLPFALGALWAAQRAWQGRPPPTWAMVAIGAMAALAGWQAVVVAVVAGAIACVATARSKDKIWAAPMGLLGGVAVGLIVDLAWTWWVDGGLKALINQGASRTHVPTNLWFHQQVDYAVELYGVPLLALVAGGLVTALLYPDRVEGATSLDTARGLDEPAPETKITRWASTGPAILVLFVAIVTYSTLFKHGAWVHSYWNFYGVALVGLTTATLIDATVRATRSFSPAARTATLGALTATVAVVAVSSIGTRSLSDYQIRQGLAVVRLADSLPKADSPHQIVVNTVGGDPEKPWLRWTTHGQSHDLTSKEISALRSDSLVLVTFFSRPRSLSPAVGTLNGRFALVDAANLRLLSGG